MATLADIAREAEVSPGTVSRVLNNKGSLPISKATADRVRQVARKLNYQPNVAARALATGKTRTIGLFYRGTTETMFLRILEAVERRAREWGYRVVVSSNLESFVTPGIIDGLIYIASLDDVPALSALGNRPVVLVSPERDEQPRTDLVTWSEWEAAHLAVKHLASLGHRRIGAIWGEYPEPPAQAVPVPRVAGFRAAVAEFRLESAECFGAAGTDPIERGAQQMRRLLDEHPDVTGVFARNDYLALGALKALQQARIAVPEQISLVHFGNSILSEAVYPELTSVSHPNAEASVIALEKLIDRNESGGEGFPTITLPITLCERASCAAVAAAALSSPSSRDGISRSFLERVQA